MEMTGKPPSKSRVVLMWSLMIGVIAFWVVLWLWLNHRRMTAEESPEAPADNFAHAIFSLFVGGFFLVAGLVCYFVAILTGCFSSGYRQPVWMAAKRKLYFVNIIATVLLALGLGFILSAFTASLLMSLGLDPGMAFMAPVMFMVGRCRLWSCGC